VLPRVVLEGDELVHLTFHRHSELQLPSTLCDMVFRWEEWNDSGIVVGACVDDVPTCLWCITRR